MKKHILLCTNLVICLIIIAGFVGTTLISHQTYKKILEDDIENISKLTSSNIYAEIDSELTKPIFVAQTMANDSFLKKWLYEEKTDPDDAERARGLQEYLYAYRAKYQYDAVYMISASSNIYYYFDGVNKVVSPENEHDQWYYRFLESGVPYCLNIDSDEVNQDELTVFVDCRVEGAHGELLGVTGVGVKMSRLQELLRQHETDYDLQAFLINGDGQVQVDTDSSRIEAVNLFEEFDLGYLKEAVLGNLQTMEIHWYPQGQMDNCLITRYIENMDWYLVVQKNTRAIRDSFQELVRKDLVVIAVMLALLLTVSATVIRQYNRMMVKALNMDALTGLPNQQSFNDAFALAPKRGETVLFLFDVDRFKRINDTKGHLFGNRVLAQVAQVAKDCVGDLGLVARWGGDEFIGTLALPPDEAERVLDTLRRRIASECRYEETGVTVSVGMTCIEADKALDVLIIQADQALYAVKDLGGDSLRSFEKLEQPRDTAGRI